MDISEVAIDEEFKTLLPAITDDQLKELGELIDKHGWTEPLIYWESEGVLIDGHHRYGIWERDYQYTELPPPKLVGMHFEDRAEVMEWIVSHQRSRRNWTKKERDAAIRKLYAEEVKPKGRPKKTDENTDKPAENKIVHSEPLNSEEAGTARKKVADAVGVSESTVQRAVSKPDKKEPSKPETSIVLDGLERPVPDDMRDRQGLSGPIMALGRKLDTIKKEAAGLSEQPGGVHIHIQTLGRELKAAKRTLTESRYFCECPRCGGTGIDCRNCDDSGFIPYAKKGQMSKSDQKYLGVDNA